MSDSIQLFCLKNSASMEYQLNNQKTYLVIPVNYSIRGHFFMLQPCDSGIPQYKGVVLTPNLRSRMAKQE